MTHSSSPADDYVLGTDPAELDRLNVQHEVWRPHMLAAWDRASLGMGDSVVDLGSGPGFVTLELADRVGPAGQVVAIERSARFVEHLEAAAKERGLAQLRVVQADVERDALGQGIADAVWVRWLLCFLADPRVVLEKAVAALKPGGVLILHEYVAYESWRMLPPSAALDRFVALVMRSWRDGGGEPNIAVEIPTWLGRMGLSVTCTPIVGEGGPESAWWRWPAGFIRGNRARLEALGYLRAEESVALGAALEADLARAHVRMVGPIVLETIARKPD